MALVTDRELFRLCEAHQQALIESRFSDPWEIGREIIWRSTRSMLQELQKNPYEDQTYQRLVDMGHCFSPALEAATGYHMHHGEAVAIDMALTVTLAEALGMINPDERDRFIDVLRQAGLPIYSPQLTPALCETALDEAEQHRGGAVHFPVPVEIGRCVFIEERTKLPNRLIEAALLRLSREAKEMHLVTH